MGKKKPLKPARKDSSLTVAEVFKSSGVSEGALKDPVAKGPPAPGVTGHGRAPMSPPSAATSEASRQALSADIDESLSVSRTLGDKDTSSDGSSVSYKDAEDSPRKEGKPQASWADLFKGDRSKKKGLDLQVLKDLPDIFDIEPQELDDTQAAWGSCLVGYFAGRFPGKIALLKLCNSWNVKFNYYAHSSGWLIFRFENEVDRDRVMAEGPYFVFGRPLMLKIMPSCFEFDDKDVSLMPVWINLPGLPLDCWNSVILSKICSKIGKPLTTDHLTASKERVSYARILVEIDASRELVRSVHMRFPSGKIRSQPVIYEFEPKFCPTCKVFGHSLAGCKTSSVEVGRKTTETKGVGPSNQEKDAGPGVRHKGGSSLIQETAGPPPQTIETHKKELVGGSSSQTGEVPAEDTVADHGKGLPEQSGMAYLLSQSKVPSDQSLEAHEADKSAALNPGPSTISEEAQDENIKDQVEMDQSTSGAQKHQKEAPNQVEGKKKKKSHNLKESTVESSEIIAGKESNGRKANKGRKDKGVFAEKLISIPKTYIRRGSSLHIS